MIRYQRAKVDSGSTENSPGGQQEEDTFKSKSFNEVQFSS